MQAWKPCQGFALPAQPWLLACLSLKISSIFPAHTPFHPLTSPHSFHTPFHAAPPPFPRAGGPPLSDEPPSVGSIHRGVVQTIKPFGVFVAIEGFRKHVLIHHTQVKLHRGGVRGGDVVTSRHLYRLVVPAWGVVQTIKPFGVFVAIAGFRKHMLIHHTQVIIRARGGGGDVVTSRHLYRLVVPAWGVVQTIKPFGVFVAIAGFRKHVLIHHTQVIVRAGGGGGRG